MGFLMISGEIEVNSYALNQLVLQTKIRTPHDLFILRISFIVYEFDEKALLYT